MPNLSRHTNVALELSGGKDSVAVLYLMKEFLDRITVYWLNTGDSYPETVKVIEKCKELCPNFIEVKSDVLYWKGFHGIPSDVVVATGVNVNQKLPVDGFQSVDSFVCCAHNRMNPLHDRVIADGNTCIIRGQKRCDEHKAPILSGDMVDGIEFIFPIEDWTDSDVMEFLVSEDAPIHPIYEYQSDGADCLHCTGWWRKTSLRFLATNHRNAYEYVTESRQRIRESVEQVMRRC